MPSAGVNRADYPRLPEAADFGLAGGLFLAAVFFALPGFALAPGLSAAAVWAGGALSLAGAFFAGLRGRATGLPSRSAISSRASERVMESGAVPFEMVALTLPQLT